MSPAQSPTAPPDVPKARAVPRRIFAEFVQRLVGGPRNLRGVDPFSASLRRAVAYCVTVVLCSLVEAPKAWGSAANVAAESATPEAGVRRLGVETSATFPYVHIYMAQAGIQLFERDDLLLGGAYQNWQGNDFGSDVTQTPGTAHAITMILGYRWFLWKGLHVEWDLFPAYNWMDSRVDGRRYAGWELWTEERLGYRFDFSVAGAPLYVIPQPGIGHALWLQKLWPGLSQSGYRVESLVFVPQVIVGVVVDGA